MVKAAALAEAAAVVVVVVFRAVIITSLGRGGGGSGIGSGCKDKIKGQGLWAGSFQPAGCHYLVKNVLLECLSRSRGSGLHISYHLAILSIDSSPNYFVIALFFHLFFLSYYSLLSGRATPKTINWCVKNAVLECLSRGRG